MTDHFPWVHLSASTYRLRPVWHVLAPLGMQALPTAIQSEGSPYETLSSELFSAPVGLGTLESFQPAPLLTSASAYQSLSVSSYDRTARQEVLFEQATALSQVACAWFCEACTVHWDPFHASTSVSKLEGPGIL